MVLVDTFQFSLQKFYFWENLSLKISYLFSNVYNTFVYTSVERIDKLHPFSFFIPHDETDKSDFTSESIQ